MLFAGGFMIWTYYIVNLGFDTTIVMTQFDEIELLWHLLLTYTKNTFGSAHSDTNFIAI